MKVGDKVYLEDRESEIIAISYDEQGEKIYTVKDSPKDYYEHDFYEFMHSELHATQNLLEEYKEAYADYQELGKEYANLQDELKEIIKENTELKEKYGFDAYFYENSISKDKIKEKIEEIKSWMNDDCLALHEFQREAQIDVLQELLKGE